MAILYIVVMGVEVVAVIVALYREKPVAAEPLLKLELIVRLLQIILL